MTILWVLSALASEGMDAVGRGDQARYEGERREARRAYREAAHSGEPAAEAMARLRLLGMSGNLGLLVHGPRIDKALMEGEGGPWDWLALADYNLFVPPELGADPADAVRFAQWALPQLPGPALARLYLATGDPEYLERLAATPERDGLGEALLAHQGAPAPDPGTWYLGLGFAGSREIGFGGGFVFQHPDLAAQEWKLGMGLFASTRGTFSGQATLRSPGEVYGLGTVSAVHGHADLYQGDAPLRYGYGSSAIGLGTGLELEHLRLGLLGRVRWDQADPLGPQWMAGHGGSLRAGWEDSSGWGADRRGWGLSAGVDASFGYPHLGTVAEGRLYLGALHGVSALRVCGEAEWMDQAPFFVLPSAGGADLHRGAATWRYRAPWLVAADLEQRWMLTRTLEAVLFVDGVWVAEQGVHPGGGVGIRLLLPPQAFNVVRVDLGISDTGWEITTAWGETF